MRPHPLALSSPGARWALPAGLERQGRGIAQGPSWWRRDDLTTGLSGIGPSTTSSRKTVADPRLCTSVSREAVGRLREGRRGKSHSRCRTVGGASTLPRPSQQASFSAGSQEVLKGPEEADQEHSWQPGRSHSVPPGKVSPKGNILSCCPGQRAFRGNQAAASSGRQTLATKDLYNA